MALSYYAVSPYGLETLLADELHRLGAQRIHPQKGGVLFEGDAALGMAACLHSRRALLLAMFLLMVPCSE